MNKTGLILIIVLAILFFSKKPKSCQIQSDCSAGYQCLNGKCIKIVIAPGNGSGNIV